MRRPTIPGENTENADSKKERGDILIAAWNGVAEPTERVNDLEIIDRATVDRAAG